MHIYRFQDVFFLGCVFYPIFIWFKCFKFIVLYFQQDFVFSDEGNVSQSGYAHMSSLDQIDI